MNITEFSQELLKIYEDMSAAFAGHQKNSGLHCLTGCGQCCNNPEVEASVMEMVPLAIRVYQEGKLDYWLDRLEKNQQAHCVHYQSHSPDGSKGMCGVYGERPSLCRMFGVAGHFNKKQEVTLSICKLIKAEYPELTETRLKEAGSSNVPMMVTWSYRMAELDPSLIQDKLPINHAFHRALEKIALYAQYQPLN